MRRSRIVLAIASAVCVGGALTGCATSSPGHGTGAGVVPAPSSGAPASSRAAASSVAAPPSSSMPTAPASQPPSSRTSSHRPSPPATSGAPLTSATSGPAGASTYTKRGGPDSWCGSRQLAVTGHAPPGGNVAGHTGVQLQFLNNSHRACILYGYPGADGLDGPGRTVAHATRTTDGHLGGCGCDSPRGVLVKPGQSAYAVVEGESGGGHCDRFRSLLVTPPNTDQSTPIPLAPHSCDFQVHPVVTGPA